MPRVRANGIELEYETFGRQADPAVLLVMGFSLQLTRWRKSFCQGLAAKGLFVIRYDNRDVGKSTHLADKGAPRMGELMARVAAGEAVEAPYSLEDMAADAAGLLEALGVDQAHIVGASMGGMIAQLVAIRHPARTRSLVSIMSTTGRRDLPPPRPEALAVLMTPPASADREDRIAASIKAARTIGSPAYPASDADLRAGAERDVDRAPYDPAGLARQMAAILAAPPRNELLSSVRAPALVIHGADDPLVLVECGRDTAASIPGAGLIVLPGAAHDFPEVLTPVYLEHVGGFVLRVEAQET